LAPGEQASALVYAITVHNIARAMSTGVGARAANLPARQHRIALPRTRRDSMQSHAGDHGPTEDPRRRGGHQRPLARRAATGLRCGIADYDAVTVVHYS
jgi:hypothetical protein